MAWRQVEVPELPALPAPVWLRAQNLAAGEMFPLHSHRWHQFVYATEGALAVTVADAWHVITPEQAIWLPAGVPHTTGALTQAVFRNLYVADQPGLAMPAQCTTYAASPLLRALIIELASLGPADEAASGHYPEQLRALLCTHLGRLHRQDLHLPWPRSAALQRLCEALYACPADERGMDEWGLQLGACGRTLTRRLQREVGLGLRAWRQRLRLLRALEWLCAGRGVTEIALDLGYASTAAFSHMFRQEMGCTPSQWRSR